MASMSSQRCSFFASTCALWAFVPFRLLQLTVSLLVAVMDKSFKSLSMAVTPLLPQKLDSMEPFMDLQQAQMVFKVLSLRSKVTYIA